MAATRAIELAAWQVEQHEGPPAHAGTASRRAAIGEANRGIYRGFTHDRRTARSLAFRVFNKSRALLRRAELALVAKQAALAALTAPAATH